MIEKITFVEYRPNIAIPPGETLKETLEAIGMTQVELARRMDRPVKTINEIINGKAAITAETALQLEKVFNVAAQFWINLEMNFQTNKARLEQEKELEKQVSLVTKFPYNEMTKWDWVKKTNDKIEE